MTAMETFRAALSEANEARQKAIESGSDADHFYADALASLIAPRVELAAFCDDMRARALKRLVGRK